VGIIPFYGAERPEMFAIERRAMDRDGLVIEALDRLLPAGTVVDIGAGDGFTAERLGRSRTVIALEPDAGMIARTDRLTWVRGEAEHLPFADRSVDAAYATWAHFFSRDWDPTPGIAELDRVVTEGGPIAIVDNLGDDAFCAMAESEIGADSAFWARHAFHCEVIETAFVFTDRVEAEQLLDFYFGDRGVRGAATTIPYRIGLFCRGSRGAPA